MYSMARKGLPLVRANLVSRTDVWMVEGGSGLRLPLETLHGLRVLTWGVREELEGYEPAEALVFGLAHDPHASAPKPGDNAVVRNGLANHGTLAFRKPRSNGCEMVSYLSRKFDLL
jgi:hypothetical protein